MGISARIDPDLALLLVYGGEYSWCRGGGMTWPRFLFCLFAVMAAAALGISLFWFCLFAVMAVAAHCSGTLAFSRLRTITDTPTARIQSASQGFVVLSGQARPHLARIQGSLTGRPCLWYRYSIERSDKSRESEWSTVESGVSPDPFLLDDGTGQCILDPVGPDCRLRKVCPWTGPHRNPRNLTPKMWYQSSDRYRYIEERIEDGDLLCCLGRLETPLHSAIERDQVLPRLAATGDARQPFVISTYAKEELASSLRSQTLRFAVGFVVLGVAAVLMVVVAVLISLLKLLDAAIAYFF